MASSTMVGDTLIAGFIDDGIVGMVVVDSWGFHGSLTCEPVLNLLKSTENLSEVMVAFDD